MSSSSFSMRVRGAWLVAPCLLASLGMAQSAAIAEIKLPRPLAHASDVKTPPPAPTTQPTAQRQRSAPQGHVVVPQKAESADTQQLARPIDFSHVYFDAPGDGALWAHGETYKASADGARFTYIPFFGSKAPRNFPVSFALESVSVGGEALALSVSGVPQRSDDRVLVDRGGATELYDLDPLGAKQEFVFETLPRGGELALRLAVTSELSPRSGVNGIEFANELGFVRYGKATAFDAAGRSIELESVWNDGAIEMRVPASFVASARLPLSIDPVISTFSVDASTTDEQSSDIAYDAATNTYLTCWERVYSATDHDIWAQEHDSSGAIVSGTTLTIDFTTNWWAHPRVATNALSTQFLVVAAVGDPSGAVRTIWGRERESEAPYTHSAQFQISEVGAFGDQLDPDVGGDPVLVGPTYYCVAWTRVYSSSDRDVHARLVTSSGTLLGTSTVYIDNSGLTYDINPTVSKSDGPAPFNLQEWNLSWERTLTNGFSEIHAAQVHWDGTQTTPSFLVPGGGLYLRRPMASPGADIGGQRYYMIAYEYDFSTDTDIAFSVMNGATQVENRTLPALELNGLLYQNQVMPAVETDGSCFAIVYSEQYQSSSFDYDMYVTSLYFNGSATTMIEGHRNLAFSSTFETDPQLTSERSGGGSSHRFGADWTDEDFSQIGNIEGGLYECPPSAAAEAFCFGDGSAGVSCPCGAGFFFAGCPNSLFAGGAQLFTSGNANVSNDTFVLHGADMPNATAVYFQATDSVTGFVIDDGIMCAGGTIIRLGSKLNAGNQSQYPAAGDATISVRGAIPANAGVTRVYQTFYRNAATFCTPATSNRTNAIRQTWLP